MDPYRYVQRVCIAESRRKRNGKLDNTRETELWYKQYEVTKRNAIAWKIFQSVVR